MAPENVLTQEERNRNFFEADKRRSEAISELEHLRKKGQRIRDVCMTVRDIFDKMDAERMVADWNIKRSVAPTEFECWPDLSLSGLQSFVSAIGDQARILNESEQEMNRMRGSK